MKTIAFVFVPIYVEKNAAAVVQAMPPRQEGKARQIQFSQDRQSQADAAPFWTWFIENPRPSSLHQP